VFVDSGSIGFLRDFVRMAFSLLLDPVKFFHKLVCFVDTGNDKPLV